MNNGSKLRRRDFLRLSVVAASSATLAACAGSNVLPQEAGAMLGDGTMVFNMYAQPAAQGRGYVYSSDPVIQLDLGQEFPRNQHQLDNLRAVAPHLSAGDSAFGPSLDWAYREYIVRRLSAGDGDAAALLGDAPAQAVDLATRRRQMQALVPIARPAAPDEPRLCLFNVLVALEWRPDQAYMPAGVGLPARVGFPLRCHRWYHGLWPGGLWRAGANGRRRYSDHGLEPAAAAQLGQRFAYRAQIHADPDGSRRLA